MGGGGEWLALYESVMRRMLSKMSMAACDEREGRLSIPGAAARGVAGWEGRRGAEGGLEGGVEGGLEWGEAGASRSPAALARSLRRLFLPSPTAPFTIFPPIASEASLKLHETRI
mgnify:FL=1